MFARQKEPPPTPSPPKKDKLGWFSAAIAGLSILFTVVGAALHLDGRILKLEAQNAEIRSDLAEINLSIKDSVYPRREAELSKELTATKIEALDKRISSLEKSR